MGIVCIASPAPVAEEIELDEIVVSASRTERASGDLPGSVIILTSERIRDSAAQTVDDFLRQVPGFSLFRRSSSIVAHPTTQGVSLRGTGASGASRTLVLIDGMPLNDPFGGWVQWGKVPLSGINRVEILRGGSAHLWGNYALSGVLNLVTAKPASRTTNLSARVGTGRTVGLDVSHSEGNQKTRWGITGGLSDTDGYHVLQQDQRGAIDQEATSRAAVLRTHLRHNLSDQTQIALQIGGFIEDRGNGTAQTDNATKSAYASAELSHTLASSARLRFSTFGHIQRFNSAFTSQAADRNSERPALDQFSVPAYVAGASATYIHPIANRSLLTLGADFRHLKGSTNERFFYNDGVFLRERKAGGRQRIAGLFVQNVFLLSERTEFTLGVRWDRREDAQGFRAESEIETGQSLRDDSHASQTHDVVSPRGGIRHRLNDDVSIRAAGYRTYRSASLNELFRPFRVGNVITAANEGLESERLTGWELGLDWSNTRAAFSTTGYWNEIDGSIANLAIGRGPGVVDPCGFVPAGGLCRQRTNLGRVRVRGFEAEARLDETYWSLTASYLRTDTEIRESPEASLEGKRLPQIPEHGFVLRLSLTDAEATSVSVQARYVATQFEDTANTLPLGAFTVVDAVLRKRVGNKKEVFIQAENLLNTSYDVGVSGSGLRTIGAPFRLQAGIRTTFE